jgi:hypothetical protein
MVNLTTSVKHFFCINKILGLIFCDYDKEGVIIINTSKMLRKMNFFLLKKYAFINLGISYLRLNILKSNNYQLTNVLIIRKLLR